jgi:two-component system, sporulation sensor kinase E
VGRFSLIRYFAAARLALIARIAVRTGWLFSRNLEESLTSEASLYAQDMSVTLNRAIFTEFLLERSRRGEPIDLTDPAQLHAVDAIVKERMEGLRILTLNLFEPDGTIVYSTKPDYIGYRSLENPGLEAALTGTPASLLKRAELEQDPIRPGHDLLETYSPFRELDESTGRGGEIIGVIELYQDARPITGKIQEGRRQILLETGAIMTALFALLFAIVRRGDLRIRELTFALEASNRGLEQRVDERTHESERARRRLESLFNGIADGISVVDADFTVLQANAGSERLFGGPHADLPPHCYERHAGRGSPCESCPARRTLETGARAEQRYRWPTRMGVREVEVTTFRFSMDDGKPGVIEVVRDVSERGELERQIVQAQSLASLGGMAAGVAHEIRNPLGMIMSSAQLLSRAEELSPRDRELLQVVRDESARVERTISEFVHFATPPEPSRAATSVTALLERVQSVLRPEAEQRGIRIELAPAAELPRIFVDAELLYRALANLVLNAIQVQGSGGMVRLEAAADGAKGVQIRVLDSGPGIPEEDLERVFQPFFSRRAGGTGLGLSIVQRIVAANGGRIAVASGPGGTMFTLRFAEATP